MAGLFPSPAGPILDLRSMNELLQIPILGIESAIVIPAVLADEFEIKPTLIDFVSNNLFYGFEEEDPHSHIRRFYQITRTLRLNQVPDDVVKLILFSFSLKGAAETWFDKEPPNSITSWDDLVSKFLNRFYPHSKTRAVRREIMNFQQVFGKTFTEAWERFNDLSRESGGNMMTKNTQEALIIIERKAIVRTYRNKYVQEKQAANLAVQKEQEEQAAQRDEHLCTIPEKKSDEFIKSSVEDLVPIPSESEDASDNENECDVLVCDDSSPLDVLEDNPVIFSNPLFNSNEDFTSSEDELLSEENVPKETFKIYSNPLFEFDDDFTSSDVNSLNLR
ncbi:reverse transcriptase domain-containing protein [Tanacetum coccineum]